MNEDDDPLAELARMNARARRRQLHYGFRVFATVLVWGMIMGLAVLILPSGTPRIVFWLICGGATTVAIGANRALESVGPAEPE